MTNSLVLSPRPEYVISTERGMSVEVYCHFLTLDCRLCSKKNDYLCGMNKMIRLFVLVISLSMCCFTAYAQKKKGKVKGNTTYLSGHVLNSFTKSGIEAKVYLMREDSSLVDTIHSFCLGYDAVYSFEIPAQPAKYIIKAEHKDYHTTFVDYEVSHIGRNTSFDVPWHYMKRKNPQEDLNQKLDEVQVVASKVKVLHKGDTLVFNADAFNVPDGSMLDDLIKQLPGVELRRGGEIYVNGRKIDELLLNGNKFVSSDNQLMLENLPYYVVKDISVYEDSTEMDKWRGRLTEKKEYVMNVKMKKEFQGGYIGRVDVAGGTQERYLGRLFGMRFDDHNQLLIFGNMNNTGNQGDAWAGGEWDDGANREGEHTFKKANINWVKDAKDKSYSENLSANINWQDSNNESHNASEQFLTGGNVYNRSTSTSASNQFSFYLDQNLSTHNVWSKFHTYSTVNINYSKQNSSSLTRSAELSHGFGNSDLYDYAITNLLDTIFTANKETELYSNIVNRTFSQSDNQNKTLTLSGTLQLMKGLPWGDNLTVELGGQYYDTSKADSYSLSNTEQLQAGTTDFRNRFDPAPYKSYRFNVNTAYDMDFLSGWQLNFAVAYEQEYNSTTNEYYRLDRLGKGWDADGNTHILGQLPSTRDSLLLALDMSNSKWHDNLDRKWYQSFSVRYSKNNHWFSFMVDLEEHSEWMKYRSEDFNENKKRTNVLPAVNLNYTNSASLKNKEGEDKGYRSYGASYNFNVNRPEFTELYDIFDNTNPLSQRLSNPDLKNCSYHNFNANYYKTNFHLNQSFGVTANLQLAPNQWGSKTAYDRISGVYTFKPGNVNGNWSTNNSFNYAQNLDSASHWYMTHSINYSFNHSVDFDTSDDIESTELSKVNNSNLNYRFGLQYTYADLTANLNGNFRWRNSTSKREDFQTINAYEYNYGVDIQYTIPWIKLQLSTNFEVYSRRGYQSSEMNTDDCLWNISLSRSFLKNNTLTLKLTAQDILNQQSSKFMSINAQGRSENWQRMIPNFILLHVIYRIEIFKNKEK